MRARHVSMAPVTYPAFQAQAPWRLVSKLKADPGRGPARPARGQLRSDETALKLTGLADVRFEGIAAAARPCCRRRRSNADKLLAEG